MADRGSRIAEHDESVLNYPCLHAALRILRLAYFFVICGLMFP